MHQAAALALAVAALSGCAHEDRPLRLTAPFDEHTTVGDVTAVWRNTGDERAFAAGTRLKEPEVRFQYRGDVRNRLGDRLFVRLSDFQLVDSDGLPLATDATAVSCALGEGVTQAVIAGDVWIPRSRGEAVHGFRLAHLAVPLGQHGLARYREWLQHSRPGHTADIDLELAQYAATPACVQR